MEEDEEEKAMVEAARTEASKVQEPFMVMAKSDEGRRISADLGRGGMMKKIGEENLERAAEN